MNITMQGKYQTRDGRAVRILATDVKGTELPVLGLITFGENEDDYHWTLDGRYRLSDEDNDLDLIPVPTKHEGWVFISPERRPLDTIYPTIEAAKDWEASTWVCSRGFVTLARVTWES